LQTHTHQTLEVFLLNISFRKVLLLLEGGGWIILGILPAHFRCGEEVGEFARLTRCGHHIGHRVPPFQVMGRFLVGGWGSVGILVHLHQNKLGGILLGVIFSGNCRK
jgi:hypothetical protein